MTHGDVEALFCDENPGMTLYAPGSAAPLAGVSFWRSTLSPLGAGHVLALWLADGPGAAIVHVHADNRALGHAVFETFLRHWPPFDTLPVPEAEVREARFAAEVDGHRLYRVSCMGADLEILAEWRGLRPARRHPAHSHPGIAYGGTGLAVEHVMCYCDAATIQVDGSPLNGVPRHDGAEGTSAYVTLCETWYPVSATLR